MGLKNFSLFKRKNRAAGYKAVQVLSFCILLGSSIISDKHVLSPGNNHFPVARDRNPVTRLFVVATAYSSDIGQTDFTPCIPSNGYDLCRHYEKYGSGNTIAANFLPLETQVRIPDIFGEKVFVVRDRMNERYGYGRIDIWMPDRMQAKTFGVKYVMLERFGGGQWRIHLAKR